MQLVTIHYERLVNLGNYENEKYAVDVAVGEGDNPAEVAKFAKHFVEQCLGLLPVQPPAPTAEDNDPTGERIELMPF